MADNTILPKMASGQRYGRLTAICFEDRGVRGAARWKFRCDCGSDVVVYANRARTGSTKSCGCLRAQNTVLMGKQKTHGYTGTPTYVSWERMLSRCRNPNSDRYSDYGGRGISVCERWIKFENFLADMGERPADKTLDRYPNNDGNYEPTNCRWATAKQQALNRRSKAA